MPATLDVETVRCDVGDTWRGWLRVYDHYGIVDAADSVTVAVVLPDESTSTGTATRDTPSGLYLLEYDLTVSGLHQLAIMVASASFGNDVITCTAYARAVTGQLPDASAITSYLGETSATGAEIADAIAAETAAQAARCRIPADYPDDLGQALKRRVARNLAARGVLLAQYTSFEGGTTSTQVPRLDAEIQRFEAPWRRMPVA
jgi:hypothetical protein